MKNSLFPLRGTLLLLLTMFLSLFALQKADATLSGRKIGLDPGHGAGVNMGVYIAEGTWTLDAANRARTHLTNDKAAVVMTRTTGADPSLGARQNILNSNNVHLMVCIHSNAASAAAVGIETYWCNQKSFASSSKNLADKLRIRALNMVHNQNRGTKECLQAGRGFHFGMLRYTNMPGSLPEYYFHTNPWENQNLHNTTTGRENIAKSIYAAVCDYYGQTPVFGGGSPPAKSTKFKTNDWVKVVDTDSLNLRSGPSTGSSIIKALPRNTVAQVKSHSNNGVNANSNYWWYVEVYPDGTKGWLAEYYLEKTTTPIKTYKLTTQTAGSGSVSRSPNATDYNEGTKVTLTATAGANYKFSHWSGDASGSANPLSVTMNSAKTIKAHFTENTKYVDKIIDNRDPGFSASSNWETASWADDKYKTDYHFRAVEGVSDPATWTFDIPYSGTYLVYAWWTAFENRSAQAPYVISHKDGNSTVRVDQQKNGGKWNLLGTYKFNKGQATVQLSCWTPNAGNDIVVADGIRFVSYDEPPPIPKYALTTKTSGSGSVAKSPNASTYDEGTSVKLTATPAKYHTFSHWSGDASGSANPVTITMNKAKTVTAHFTADPASVDIIVDNSDSGFTASANWKTSTSGTDKHGANYAYRDVEGVADSASFKADIPFEGTYEVFAWWSAGSNRSEVAPYVIYHKGGSETVRVNQRANGGKWNSLGTYTFEAGETQILLSCWTPNSGNDIVVADAVRFVTYEGPPPPPKFALTTQTEGIGTISRNPDAATYNQGTTVTLTASPASTHTFSHWSGGASGSTNPVTITMDAAKTVKAHFTPKNFSLTTSAEGPGTVQGNPAGTSHPYGTTVTLTATPAANHEFSHWSGGASGSTNPLTVTIDGNKNITAHFILKSYTLTTQTAGTGSVTKSPDKSKYDHGSTVTLTATPGEGQILARWSGDASGTANPLTVTMNSAKTIKAHFEPAPPTVDIIVDNSDPGFTASANWETVTSGNDKHGANYRRRLAEGIYDPADWRANLPFAGTYEVYAWWPAAATNTEVAPYLIYHSNGSTTVRADQKKDGGKWNLLGTFEFDKGEARILLSCWVPNHGEDTIMADAVRFVTYDPAPPPVEFALTTQTEGSGTISANPQAAKYSDGTSVILTATPAANHEFSHWSGDATGNTNPLTVTMDSAKTIKATFIPKSYPVTISTVGGGTVQRSPDHSSYDHGTTVTLLATADPGFEFIGWSGDATGTSNPATITVDSAKSISAEFVRSYTGWKNALFSGDDREIPEISGPDADPMGHGIPNLLKFAFGLDLENPDFSRMPAVQSGKDGLVITFNRLVEPAGIEYIIETSSDLKTWTPAPDLFSETDVTPNPDGETEEVTATTKLSLTEENPRLFVRIVVREQ